MRQVLTAIIGALVLSASLMEAASEDTPTSVSALGPLAKVDTDDDGVWDVEDRCPNTPKGMTIWLEVHVRSGSARPEWLGCGAGQNPAPITTSRFETVESWFKQGTAPAQSALIGTKAGRCFDYSKPNTPVATVLAGEERVPSPGRPAKLRLGLLLGGKSPDLYDDLTLEAYLENKTVFKEIGEWKSMHPATLVDEEWQVVVESPCYDRDTAEKYIASMFPEKVATLPTNEEITLAMNIQSMRGVASRTAAGSAMNRGGGETERAAREGHNRAQIQAIRSCKATATARFVAYENYIVSRTSFTFSHPANVVSGNRPSDHVSSVCYYFQDVVIPPK
jgi:hypothetical protein